MRYKERKDQSAELLRLALAEMGRHDASYTPINFTVWYEHVAGINPRLSEAIVHQQRLEPRFGNETVERLHREHIAEIDSAKAERISDMMRILGLDPSNVMTTDYLDMPEQAAQ